MVTYLIPTPSRSAGAPASDSWPGWLAIPFGAAAIILLLLIFWISIAAHVKRFHDLGHTGWLILLSLVPLVNFACLIWMGFVRGDIGANRFGTDPCGPIRRPDSSPMVDEATA